MATIWGNTASPGFGGTSSPSSGGSMFYNPTSTYGATQPWNNTPVAGIIREQNPQLAYAQYGQGLGIGDNQQNFNRWFYNQFPSFERAFGLATLQNPTIRMDDFLQTLPGMQQIRQQFNMASPVARGLSHSTFSPQTRWIAR